MAFFYYEHERLVVSSIVTYCARGVGYSVYESQVSG